MPPRSAPADPPAFTALDWWGGFGFLLACGAAWWAYGKLAEGPPIVSTPIVLPHVVGDIVDQGDAVVEEEDPEVPGVPPTEVVVPPVPPEVPVTPPPPPEVARVDVVVDAGHGGGDPGTSGHGMQEKKFALDIAKKLAAELRGRGVTVAMTRETDQRIELSERVVFAREAGARLFVSVHLNAHQNASVAGAETWYAPKKVLSLAGEVRASFGLEPGEIFTDRRDEEMAQMVQDGVIARTGTRDRGTRQSRFIVLYQNPVPSVLVECGFLTNATEAANIGSAVYRESLALGIADGVIEMLEVSSEDPWFGVEVSGAEGPPELD